MNRKIYIVMMMAFVAVVLLTAYSGENTDYPTGAPAGYTGSPGDGYSCATGCHGGTPTNATGWITSNIPASGYVPGTTYTITATVTGTGNHGFEISPQNVSGTLLGTLIAGTNNHLTGTGGKYVTHNSAQNSNPATWTFQWIAPAAGTGTVTFYGAFCVTKPNTKLSTLVVNEFVIPVSVLATATPSTILQGASSQLDMTASGGSGSYTYSWTSIPPGFTSTLKNPVVSPSSTTQYIGHANDGTQTASDTVQVTVIPGNLAVVATANPPSIPTGQSSQLNASASGGSGNYTYSWTSNPPGFTSTISNPVVTPAVTTHYYVQVNDGYQQTSDTTQVEVTLSTLAVQATASPTSLCVGGVTQLDATATGGSSTYTYSWTSIPPGFTSNIKNPTATPTVTTKYISAAYDGVVTATDTVQVDVTQLPVVNAGPDTTYCVIVSQIPVDGTATNYTSVTWTTSGTGTFSNPNALSTDYFPTAADKTAGSVDLTLTSAAQAPCTGTVSDSRHILFDPCNGIAEGDGASVTVKPNPSDGLFTLSISGMKDTGLTIRVFNMTGQLKYEESVSTGNGTLNKTIDLTGSASGIYILRWEMNGKAGFTKLIIR